MVRLDDGHETEDTPTSGKAWVSEPEWVRGRVLADEALNDKRHLEVKAELQQLKQGQATIIARLDSIGTQAPSAREKYAAYIIATVMTVILGYLAKRVGLDLDPSQLPQLPH